MIEHAWQGQGEQIIGTCKHHISVIRVKLLNPTMTMGTGEHVSAHDANLVVADVEAYIKAEVTKRYPSHK